MKTIANHRKPPSATANRNTGAAAAGCNPTGKMPALQPSKTPPLQHSVSSFNPALPEDGALIIAAVLRDQFNSLNADIQTRATAAELAAAEAALQTQINGRATHLELNTAMAQAVSTAETAVLPQTSQNCYGVQPISQQALGYYDQNQMQEVIDKVNELLAALARWP